MSKSTHSRSASKPKKPYDGFPLTPHPTGRWCKKIRGKLHYFGRTADDEDGSTAFEEFQRQWPYLKEGRTPPPKDAGDGYTICDLCNDFLEDREDKAESGELSLHSFSEYRRTCDRIYDFFGKDRRVDDLKPDDFRAFRKSLAQGCGVVTLKSKINRARIVFKFAHDDLKIDHPVQYGKAFDRPSESVLRKARSEGGDRMFEAEEMRHILDALEGKPVQVEGEDEPVTIRADPVLRAMILLGLNCGFGNTDVASLPRHAVDLENAVVKFPRPKTGVERRCPLWPETVATLREALDKRPVAKDPDDADLCFLTTRGTRYVRVQESKTTEGRYVTINSLSRRFDGLLGKLQINGRRGLGFYTCRHILETIGGESRDQVAVDAIMGHTDRSMGGQYRERHGASRFVVSDDRLHAVVETVRVWLWPDVV